MNVTESAAQPFAAVPEVGQYWPGQGGVYAGVLPAHAQFGARHLIFSTDEGVELNWGVTTEEPIGAVSAFDGAANTDTLLKAPRQSPAAKWTHAYEKDGHHDFYLPSREEWEIAAATIPNQFSDNVWYWTSTEHSLSEAYGKNFAGDDSEWFFKGFRGNVRAARTIPAPEYDTPPQA